MEGYLQKRGDSGFLNLWKKRWFSLKPNSQILFYYDDKLARDAHGKIDLSTATSIKPSTSLPFGDGILWENDGCYFQIEVPGRTYYLFADSKELVHKWIAALNAAKKISEGPPVLVRSSTTGIPPIYPTLPEYDSNYSLYSSTLQSKSDNVVEKFASPITAFPLTHSSSSSVYSDFLYLHQIQRRPIYVFENLTLLDTLPVSSPSDYAYTPSVPGLFNFNDNNKTYSNDSNNNSASSLSQLSDILDEQEETRPVEEEREIRPSWQIPESDLDRPSQTEQTVQLVQTPEIN